MPIPVKIKALRSLVNDMREVDFIRGNEYAVNNPTDGLSPENIFVTDETGAPHKLGNWARHFKITYAR